MASVKLAIVIPAYKKLFFHKALSSLASQTNQNFNVYVGDDASPHDIKGIASDFDKRLNISYTRFNDNIGSKNLVNQWNRCIALTKEEEWIWLFSDDDIAQNNCVEKFYKELESNKPAFDVYRFNTVVIDEEENIIHYTPRSPKVESSEELAYNILYGKRGNCMPDHIFSRKVYNANGGIVFTNFAQGADWATSILFAKDKGLCIIDDAVLYWRYGGNNISGMAYLTKNETTLGHVQFLEWVLKHFEYLKEQQCVISYAMIKKAVVRNFKVIITSHYRGYNKTLYNLLFAFLHHKVGLPVFRTSLLLLEIKVDCLTPAWITKYRHRAMGILRNRIFRREKYSIAQH